MNINIKISKIDNLISQSIYNFIIKSKYKQFYNFSYKTQKHNLLVILAYIILVIRLNIPWNSFNSISKSTIHKAYSKLIYRNILSNTYFHILRMYLNKSPSKKLTIKYTDTTFVSNKYGSELVHYNGHKKRKGTKISIITDSVGIPLNVAIYRGNQHDSTIFKDHMKCLRKDARVNYILADGGYDTNEIRKLLNEIGYVPIIHINNKNTKDLRKIRQMPEEHKKMYKLRILIEHTNNKLKNYRRINIRYDRNTNTFMGSIMVGCIGHIMAHLNK